MDANDAADQVVEAGASESRKKSADEKFRSTTALAIAIMAMFLAITSVGGNNAAEDMMINNIQASNAWAFYQAKTLRQAAYTLSAYALEAQSKLHQHSASPEVTRDLQREIEKYRATAARYEDEPDATDPGNAIKGEGKKQLLARARDLEAKRDKAMRQDSNFDYSEALFQIAILLASVSILSSSRPLMKLSIGLGMIALVLMVNGFFLLFELPG